MKNGILTETKIGEAEVVIDILPKGKAVPNIKMINSKPTSITVHDTGNWNASSKNNHTYMKNCNKTGDRIASWHFTVGDDKIYQAIECNEKAYHSGCKSGNNTSIGVEICIYRDITKLHKAYKNAIALIKILMKEYDIPVSKIKQHNDWTGKNCPGQMRCGFGGYRWDWFINQLRENKNGTDVPYVVRIKTKSLNIRSGASMSYSIVGEVRNGQAFTIVEINGDWGKLKSGKGWIHLGYCERIDR